MPNVPETSEVLLFADDVNVIACSSKLFEFQSGLLNIKSWLVSNKLTLNTDKTTLIKLNKNTEASNLHVALDNIVFCSKESYR